MPRYNRAAKWIAILTACLLLSACGGGSGDTPAADSGSPDGDTGSTTAPAGANVLKGTCTTTPETMDPARGSGENDLLIFVNLYETLVVPNDVNAGAEPYIATEWDVSDDGLTWLFTLRDDVTFSDGTGLTAHDVKYSMDRLTTIGEGFAFIFMDLVEETNAVEDYKVEFKLSQPFGPFINALTTLRIVNKSLLEANTADGNYGENGDYGTGYLLANSAGSGPYRIEEFLIHDTITMSKNEHYWKDIPQAAPDTVVISELQDAATSKMLLTSGDVDMIHGHQENTTLESLVANDNIQAGNMPEMGLNYFMMNTQKAPTDDVHIRKAISHAANYSEMSDIYGGMPDSHGPVPPTLWGATTGLTTYEYDLDKAREEISQSAYADNLQDHPVEIAYIQGNGDTGKLAMLLARDLESVGFNVQINEVPWVLFCNNEAEIGTSPHITNAFCTTNYPEAGSILEFKYASWTVGNWNQNEWLLDDRFDGMLNEALSLIDDDARLAKYAEMQRYLTDDVVPSLYPFANVLKPIWNTERFRWRLSDDNPHPAIEYNYYYADFQMQ